jgi:hypothetical protein
MPLYLMLGGAFSREKCDREFPWKGMLVLLGQLGKKEDVACFKFVNLCYI